MAKIKAKEKKPATKKTSTKVAAKKNNKVVDTKSKTTKKSSTKKAGKKNTSPSLVDIVVFGMEEKKAKDITVLDLRNTGNSVADFFVISHADSRVQVDAIANSVIDEVEKKSNEKLKAKEGKQNAEWIILDYFNVVAHIFIKERREFYNIEKLWADAEVYLKAANN